MHVFLACKLRKRLSKYTERGSNFWQPRLPLEEPAERSKAALMHPGSIPRKLRYTLHSCSGEDPEHPARELLYHSVHVKGWHSPRFCKFPQEIVLKLECPSLIHQIQVLSHEFKIATKMAIRVGTADPDSDSTDLITWKTLGHMRFDANERSEFCARELKSVHVKARGTYFHFSVQRCHINSQNIYNQVGILAINLIGEPLADLATPGKYLEVSQPLTQEPLKSSAAASAMSDLVLDVSVDPATASRIREIAAAKDAAVMDEDYDEAKRLKSQIEKLKVIGQRIASLEAKKRAAVDREDYDTAKLLKADIVKLHMAGENAGKEPDSPASMCTNPDQIFNRVLGKKTLTGARRSSDLSMVSTPCSGYPFAQEERLDKPLADDTLEASQSLAIKQDAYDDRPVQGKGNYPSTAGSSSPDVAVPPATSSPHSESAMVDRPPNGFPDNLPAPETLTSSQSKKAEILFPLVGEYVARCIFSKNWQLRDAGILNVMQSMETRCESEVGDRDTFLILCKVASDALEDRVPSVFHRAARLAQKLVEEYSNRLSVRDIQHATADILPVLVAKTGDNNARVRESAQALILFLASKKDVLNRSLIPIFLKSPKKSAWRPVLGKLELIRNLLPIFGVGKQETAFDLQSLMEFIGKSFNSPNGEVRSTAVIVTLQVFKMVGSAVRKFLPRDINPKIMAQLDRQMAGNQVDSKEKQPSNTQGARAHTNFHDRPTKPEFSEDHEDNLSDPTVYEAQVKAREKQLGPNHPEVAESLGNLAIAYNQQQKYDRAQPLLERALRIYEGAHGPTHPHVAHTLTDLAVLHLEQNQDHIGRPLLERALQIQEEHLGPDHPDVTAIKDVLQGDD